MLLLLWPLQANQMEYLFVLTMAINNYLYIYHIYCDVIAQLKCLMEMFIGGRDILEWCYCSWLAHFRVCIRIFNPCGVPLGSSICN